MNFIFNFFASITKLLVPIMFKLILFVGSFSCKDKGLDNPAK